MQRSSSLGIASMVLGILALLICWIPLVNILALPIAIVGLVLGGVGGVISLCRNGAGIGYSIAGGVLCGLSLLVAVSITKALADAFRIPPQPAISSGAADRPPSTPKTTASEPERQSASSEVAAPPPAADDAVTRIGDIEVRLISAARGKVSLKNIGDESGTSKEDLLRVTIEIRNASETKKLTYSPWGSEQPMFDRSPRAMLVDNLSNRYTLFQSSMATRVVGAVQSATSIYPGKSVEDILVFELPVGKAETLTLTLPASAVQEKGQFKIRFAADAITTFE